jgi:regulator of replication initiation timing
VVNYHHIEQITALKAEVQLAQSRLGEFHSHFASSKQTELKQQKQLKTENEELLAINEHLVVSNDKFKSLFEKERVERYKSSKYRERLASELEEARENLKSLEGKHQKEVENLRLMHAQELYILRKKEKKG